MSPSQSELTPVKSNMELTHFGSEVAIFLNVISNIVNNNII